MWLNELNHADSEFLNGVRNRIFPFGLQGDSAGEVGNLGDDADKTLCDGSRKKCEESSPGDFQQRCERKNGLLPLLRGVPWTRRTKHRRAICRPDVTARAVAEVHASSILFGWTAEVDRRERTVTFRDARIEGDSDGKRNVGDRCIPAPFAASGQSG